MATNVYVGVGDVARKVKKIYVGVNGVAQEVKKAYIGVSDVARLCYSSAPAVTLDDILADITVVAVAGRNASTSGAVSYDNTSGTIADGTYYCFSVCNANFSIFKIAVTNNAFSKEAELFRTNATRANIWCTGKKLYYSTNGTSSASAYGITLAIFSCPNFGFDAIDALFATLTRTTTAGRNANSIAAVSVTKPTSNQYIFGFFDTYYGVSKWDSSGGTITAFSGNETRNTSLLYADSTKLSLSALGTGMTSVYGGTIGVCGVSS